ncbi:unnamed protein product [Linum trigynum]|uniref:Secreted protein n=1 Tax=Linum trigynum TaxID=586398 RepID=A0AAV2FCN8_9ROSI
MVMKIKLGHLETLVRRFLALGIALSLSKLEYPSVLAEICLKGHHWAKHGRGHGRALLQPARALARFNYTARLLGETRPCFWVDTAVLWWTRPCNFSAMPVFWLVFAKLKSALGSKSTA